MEYSYKKSLANENILTVLFATASFMLPFLFQHPQLIVGTGVNAMLVLAAMRLSWKRTLPLVFLPSIGALASGIVFGPLSVFLVYMLPAIWAGNALLVYIVKRYKEKSFIIAPIYKASAIFFSAVALVSVGFIPKALLIALGPLQLFTAITGFLLALAVNRYVAQE